MKILWFGLLLFITNTCIGSEGNKNVEFTNPSKPIVVEKSNPIFSITIQSNPTTGYSWLLKNYDATLISPISSKFYPPTNKKLVGAPGYEKWTFRVKSSGFVVPQTTSITLLYARSWEMQDVQPTNFKVVTRNDN
ncbi:MAG: protease inhibitor I42 family protein [bacterium]